MKPGKAELLALIKAGVFDVLEPRRTRQVLRYFQGLENMEEVADIASDEKRRMLFESLGFLPEGDDLDLYEGKRPELRVKDLKDCAGTMVELVVRVVDARQRVTYNTQLGGNGHGGYGGYGRGPAAGATTKSRIRATGGPGDTAGTGMGTVQSIFTSSRTRQAFSKGVGETRCLTYGTPPVCFLRGEVRVDGEGVPKITKCAFLRSF